MAVRARFWTSRALSEPIFWERFIGVPNVARWVDDRRRRSLLFFNHFKKFARRVWGGEAPPGISVTRALPPQDDVRMVKNLKMNSKRRTDLKI